MTRAQREALADLARPIAEEDFVAAVRARLNGVGLLGVVASAATICGCEVDEVLSRSRRAEVVAARHAVWANMHEHLFFSYPQIGELFSVEGETVRKAVARLAARSEVPA